MIVRTLVFSLGVASTSWAQEEGRFSNPEPITISTFNQPGPDGGSRPARATPYPSRILVTDFVPNERITKVTVTLHDLSHEVSDDIDILLVGPEGQGIVLVSDAGGGFVESVTLTLDDDAEAPLPDDDSFASGTYKPSNFEPEGRDAFPDPAPNAPLATELSVLAGTNPNGFWDLYVVDDEVFDAGSIAGGWTLTIGPGTNSSPFFRRGDSDGNAAVNLTDAVFLLNSLFLGGPQPACSDAADIDDSGVLSLSDPIFLLNRLFRGGAEVPAPGLTDCGQDPTPDELGCVPGTACSN